MKEKDSYFVIKAELERLMKDTFDEFYLEITADKRYSNNLKEKIGHNRDIIFNFLREAAPDLTGYVRTSAWEIYEDDYVFTVVEVKKDPIKLDDIYQVRKYSELFDARLTFLVSLHEIPEEIKRLSRVVTQLLSQPDNEKIILAYFDFSDSKFKQWFPRNPFKKSILESLFQF